jgi:cytochrome c peroxidase
MTGAASALCMVLVASAAQPPSQSVPLGLPRIATGGDEPGLAERVRLGRKLFNDTRLSTDGSISCSKCHMPSHAFSDGRAKPAGAGGRPGTRNTPSLLNVTYLDTLFWDGRVATLEEQVHAPLLNPLEHGFPDAIAVERALGSMPEYVREFQQAFGVPGDGISIENVANAITAYERTLLSGNSPFDRFFYGHEPNAISAAARRGLELFRGRAACASCHLIGETSALFTDLRFHMSSLPLPANVAQDLPSLTAQVIAQHDRAEGKGLSNLIAADERIAALGRFTYTLKPADIGNYRTPSLRDVALTAPYMHDGSVGTLDDAVKTELYSRSAGLALPIVVTTDEQRDLVEFLRTLSSENAEGRGKAGAGTPGFASRFETEPRLVGPLIKHYEFVASGLLDAYAGEAPRASDGTRHGREPGSGVGGCQCSNPALKSRAFERVHTARRLRNDGFCFQAIE